MRLYSRVWNAPDPEIVHRTDDRDTDMPKNVPLPKRYAIIPGPVKIPGGHPDDFHFVNARELIQLYGVNPVECVILHPGDPRGLGEAARAELVVLRPRSDGNYTLPEE